MIPVTANKAMTMTSLEIADLVGSRHDKVKQSIERLAERGVIAQPPAGDEPGKDAIGRPRTTQVYRFIGQKGKRDSIIVVAQLSPEFTARLVDRWQELEAQQTRSPALPQDYLEALEKLVETEREKQAAQAEADRLQKVCQTITNQFKAGQTPHEFCRILNGVNINQVQPYLVRKGYLRKTEYGYRAMPAYRDKYFAERSGESVNGRHCEVVILTLTGAKRLYKMYLMGELQMKASWDGRFSHLILESGMRAEA